DLRGIQPTDYVQTVHWLASRGLDTREAAFRILAFPDFKAFIARHSLMLGQDYSLICMLFPMDESLFISDLVTILANESVAQAQKSLLLDLWYAVNPAGDSAIKAFANNPNNQADVTAYSKKLIEKTPGFGSSGQSSDQLLRDERRKVMQRPISDE